MFNRSETDLLPSALSQTLCQSIVACVWAGIAVISLDERYLMVNAAFCDTFGYTAEELLQTDAFQLTHPEDAASSRQVMREALEQGRQRVRYTKRYLHKDGHIIWAEVSAVLVHDADGAPKYFVTHVNDMTEQKLAEAKLRDNEERYRGLVEIAPFLIGIHRQGKVIFVNQAGARMLGADSPEALLGVAVADLVAPSGRTRSHQRIQEALDGYVPPAVYEQRFLRRDGREIDTEVTGVVFPYQGSTAIQITARDITEQKRAEEERRRLTAIVENTSDLVAMATPDGQLTYLNPAGRRMAGWEVTASLAGQMIASLHPAQAAAIIQQIGIPTAIEHGFWQGETALLGAGGIQISVSQVILAHRTADGELRYFSSVMRDITASKRAEEEVRRLNEALEARVRERTASLEAVNQELEAFSYSVSHDLRAPLRAIDGYVKILMEEYQGVLGAEGLRLGDNISRNAHRMAQLIDDLLALSRVTRMELQPSQVDMRGLALVTFEELTTPEARQRIDFRLAELPAAVGDLASLRQIWVNLLSNAIKFSAKRERAIIEVKGTVQAEEVIYSVGDNGAGFEMEYAHKLFGMFQRLHDIREFEGTGVGLAIVKRLVVRQGGHVWAEGQPNRGAVFYFALPQK